MEIPIIKLQQNLLDKGVIHVSIYEENNYCIRTSIASLVGVSRMTLYHRRAELNLLADPVHTLNDEELEHLLTEIRRKQPNLG